MSDDAIKDALKEAIKEWLDDKFATFGKWSAGALAATLFSWLVYGLLSLNGFHKI